MARPTSDHPTELELQILRILWEDSPLPVREIRDELARLGRDLAHTSVITTLNIMVRKRYLRRKKEGKGYLFSPRRSRQDVSSRMLGDVVERLYDGSPAAALLALLDGSNVDADELRELRRLIERKKREQS